MQVFKERSVRLTSQSSQFGYGTRKRHQAILTKIECKDKRPKYVSKTEYKGPNGINFAVYSNYIFDI